MDLNMYGAVRYTWKENFIYGIRIVHKKRQRKE
jgi:hypothetical protein